MVDHGMNLNSGGKNKNNERNSLPCERIPANRDIEIIFPVN